MCRMHFCLYKEWGQYQQSRLQSAAPLTLKHLFQKIPHYAPQRVFGRLGGCSRTNKARRKSYSCSAHMMQPPRVYVNHPTVIQLCTCFLMMTLRSTKYCSSLVRVQLKQLYGTKQFLQSGPVVNCKQAVGGGGPFFMFHNYCFAMKSCFVLFKLCTVCKWYCY